MVRQFTFNLNFCHCCYRCCYMYIHVVDVNKDRIFFLFGVLRPAKHKRRWDHNLKEAHFLMSWLYYYFTENTSWSCELCQNNDVLWNVRAFPKISKNSRFRPSNQRLFERIPAVPGTSNNRGLTVYASVVLKLRTWMRLITICYIVSSWLSNQIDFSTSESACCLNVTELVSEQLS